MTIHNMALTYKPKIDPVRRNVCRQTIQTMRNKPIVPGDIIKFHGWMGRPYDSPWTSRKTVTVKSVCLVTMSQCGVCVEGVLYPWDSPQTDTLAKQDYIYPATGEELCDVLFGCKGAPVEPVLVQIIRW